MIVLVHEWSVRERWWWLAFWLLPFLFLLGLNRARGSEWFYDTLLAITLLVLFTFMTGWLRIGRVEFSAFALAFLLHNLGSFGWYNASIGFFAFDTLVHLVSSLVAAWITARFVSERLHVRGARRRRRTVVDEHKVIFALLVFALVSFLGLAVELVEYAGFVHLGEGEGLFFVGAGDGDSETLGVANQYHDTMCDIITNLAGALVGVAAFFFVAYPRSPWMQSHEA